MRIPNQLLVYRRKLGLTQSEVAMQLGLQSTDRISRWEQGQTYPHLVNLFKLARIYQVSPHELYPELAAQASEHEQGNPTGHDSTGEEVLR